jgi:hypothetical protein
MIEVLSQHKKIGIDIDHTLIGNNYKKTKLQQFIFTNHTKIDFYLITFRTREWLENAEKDIIADFPRYQSHYFKGLYGIPVELEDARQEYHSKNIGNISNHLLDKMLEYNQWKGKKCSELGCTLLIDDMGSKVLLGCYKYGIKYLHPENL